MSYDTLALSGRLIEGAGATAGAAAMRLAGRAARSSSTTTPTQAVTGAPWLIVTDREDAHHLHDLHGRRR